MIRTPLMEFAFRLEHARAETGKLARLSGGQLTPNGPSKEGYRKPSWDPEPHKLSIKREFELSHCVRWGYPQRAYPVAGASGRGARRTRGVTAAGQFHYLHPHRGNPADFKGNEHGPSTCSN